MLTDESPAEWHDDEYIMEWARQRGLRKYPIAYVGLITTAATIPDLAQITWDSDEPAKVRRLHRARLTKLTG